MISWHRLFGLTLTDYFADSGYKVELEKDLSIKQQLLDVLIIEQKSDSQILAPPDGLENLARHNLLTYKSIRQSLDAWALDELVGHYVNYRKQISSSLETLLPVEDFRLYAVTTRHPEKLETTTVLKSLKDGVYEVQWGSQRIRIIVLSGILQAEHNAMWQLFSGIAEKVHYGASHYHWRRADHSKSINKLFEYYRVEGIAMPYTWDDFERDLREETLAKLKSEDLLKWFSPEELLQRLPPEERLKGLPPEERLKGLPPEERLKGLPPEERLKGLPPEELLKRLTREDIEAYLQKLSTPN